MIDDELTSPNRREGGTEQKTRILFLSASPKEKDKLQVIKECNSVEDEIKSARKYSDLFELKQRHQFYITQLQKYLREQDPQIVHFSGHGDEEGVMLFQEGEEMKASVEAIADLFRILNQDKNPNDENRIRCVILSACFSEKLAKAISKYVDCVIGMSKEISDDAAEAFAIGFYRSIADGDNIEKAFEFGRNEIGLRGHKGQDILSLIAKEDVDPKKVLFVSEDTLKVEKSIESVYKRQYHAFLSRAYVDKTIARNLYEWLHAAIPSRKGVDRIYYHEPELGVQKSTVLGNMIPNCRSIIILLSRDSVSNGWVREEYDTAMHHKQLYRDFKIIPVLIEKCNVPEFIDRDAVLHLSDGRLDLDTLKDILQSMYYHQQTGPRPGQARDLYVSRGWKEDEKLFEDDICIELDKQGFRLIGDAEDQEDFDPDRVKSIMSSCGGLVAIVPYRRKEELKTSKFILDEIVIAKNIQLPTLIIVHPKVYPHLEESLVEESIPLTMENAKSSGDKSLENGIERISEEWKKPKSIPYVFFATDLDDNNEKRREVIKHHIELITSMACKMATDYKDELHKKITDEIAHAYLVIADISDNNPNTLIESGIARGARRKLRLVAQRSADGKINPPYMLNDIQIEYYADDTELLQKVHRIAYEFRRRILNYELPSRILERV